MKKNIPMVTGYIEGFYGRLLSWSEKRMVVDRMAEAKGNAVYLLAPKEDPRHRQEWRKPYSAQWRRDFTAFVKAARRQGVAVIPGMAPGLSFDYRSKTDYARLLKKLRVFLDLGCEQVALLMDDIPAVLPPSAVGHFASLGEAHGLLLQKLAEDLFGTKSKAAAKKTLTQAQNGKNLWFCPTVYCDAFSQEGGINEDIYLRDLAKWTPKHTPIFWTGPGIVTREFGPRDLLPLEKLFPGRIMLWDNLYANDYCPWKIFLGPFLGRPQGLRQSLAGLMINPTGLVETDLFYLDLLAGWQRGEAPLVTWQQALARAQVPQEFQQLVGYLFLPQEKVAKSNLNPTAIMRARALLKPLIWNWKAPLQREWYPYLFMLDADLRLGLKGKEAPEEAWLRKRYTALLAPHLIAATVET